MNIGNTITAVAIGILISTSAFAEGHVLPIQHREKERHSSRDDLINWCTALPLQYANTTVAQHTATSDQLRDQGVELCRAGSRMLGVEKLERALKEIGVTTNLD